jgi:hypothetical protein
MDVDRINTISKIKMLTKTRQLIFPLSISLALWFCHGLVGQAQVAKLHPVDEAAKDPSFFIFRAQLLKVIQRRDSAALYSMLSPAIKNGFGGDDGITAFKRIWTPQRSTSKFWPELLTVLALGGRFESAGTFIAPYTFSNFPDQSDAFEHGAIIGDGVRVRRGAGTSHPIMVTLSFDIVKVGDWTPVKSPNSKESWIAVTLSDGQKGYVSEDYIRNPIDYRAIFNKEKGRWLMTAFVAGD